MIQLSDNDDDISIMSISKKDLFDDKFNLWNILS